MAPPPDTSREADAVLRPGLKAGDLTFRSQIGRGAQGLVFEARQESMDRTVAVKVLPKDFTQDEDHVERFRREAEAVGRLNHPNIVTVYARHEWQGHHLIVQELLDGGSLQEALDRRHEEGSAAGPAHAIWCAGICRQLAGALQHAHEHGVIHRDVKPTNVLLNGAGVPKLTDFGLAKVVDKLGLSQTGLILGTPHYMSPEQVDGRVVDARTDVYALGVVLYRMLTGRVPFTATSIEAMFLDVLTRAPPPLRTFAPGLDGDLQAVCLKALEKSPHQRYATAAEMGADLARFLADETTLARPVGPLGRAARQLRRLATSTLAVVALLVPALWLLVDALLLRPLAAQNVARHDVRVQWAALAALLMAWPLGLLAVRLAGGRSRAVAAGWLVATLMGVVAGRVVLGQRSNQIHLQERRALQQQVELGAERRDVADIEDFIRKWAPRFGTDDLVLVARAYLDRARPAKAEEWLRRVQAAGMGGPVVLALQAVVCEALGQTDQAAAAQGALWTEDASSRAGWESWKTTGDILQQTRRSAEAKRAYERSAGMKGAQRDALNRSVAGVANDLCEWSEARDALNDFLKWSPTDLGANYLAFTLAIKGARWDDAERSLQVVEASGPDHVNRSLSGRHELVRHRDGEEAAQAFAEQTCQRSAEDPVALNWCAMQAFDAGVTSEARAAATTGEDKARHQQTARARFERAAELYGALDRFAPMTIVALLGQAGANIRLAAYDPARTRALLELAIAQSARAAELDPSYWEAHYNLGLARKRLIGKNTRDMSVEELRSFLPHQVAAVECNGLDARALNDIAFATGCLARLTADKDVLHEAVGYAQRAVKLGDPGRVGGNCEQDEKARTTISGCYDTLRELQILQGDTPGALQSARAALAALKASDPKYAERFAAVQQLEQD